MNISTHGGSACVLLAFLLIGCSVGEGGQPAGTVAVVSALQAAPASSAHTPMSQAAPATSAAAVPDSEGTGLATPTTSSTPPAAQSVEATPATGSVQAPAAQPNQADQAGLAGQWEEAAIDVPGTAEPAPQPGVDKQLVRATQHAPISQVHVAPSHPADMGVAAHPGHPTQALGTRVAASQIAHAAATPAVQSVAAQRRARLTLLASRFNRPGLLRNSDTPAPPPRVMSLKMGNVGISNFDDTARVNFALKASGSDAWTSDYIDPRDSREFGCGLAGECQFWMQTGDKSPVYYMMQHDNRYAIFWDAQKAIWDLRLAGQDP